LKGKKAAYHFAFWIVAYIFWIFIFRNNVLVLTRVATIQFCYLLFIAGNFYFNSFYTVPWLLNKKKYFLFSLCFLSGILLSAVLRIPVFVFVNRYIFHVPVSRFNYMQIFFDSFINILFWVLVILATKLIVDRIRSVRYIEQIEKEKAANELNFLRAQFNPHFLFNSINSIYGHIDKSNRVAREMLLVFSEMLRYQLYECNVDKIELDKEIQFIRNYVYLQKSRMDERIQVSFCADKAHGSVMIAPLLLIGFIENAFKYVGFNDRLDNRIEIRLCSEEGNFICTVFNTKDQFINREDKSSGLGIANTRRRLELLYPGAHVLEINEQENHYTASLTLLNV
jgi:two-component system, LytTR family, sensor kinase